MFFIILEALLKLTTSNQICLLTCQTANVQNILNFSIEVKIEYIKNFKFFFLVNLNRWPGANNFT